MTQPFLETASLPEFFKGEVTRAIQHLNLKVSPTAEFYLVNLLATFSNEKSGMMDRALALQFFDAVSAAPSQRIRILKRMGDVALYISGFFGDSLLHKMIKLDYYIQMGHSAYASLSQIILEDRGCVFRELYDELAHNFTHFVDVFSDIADSTTLKNDRALLKLYERWLSTGSDRIKSLLEQEGIIPNELAKTKFTQ